VKKVNNDSMFQFTDSPIENNPKKFKPNDANHDGTTMFVLGT